MVSDTLTDQLSGYCMGGRCSRMDIPFVSNCCQDQSISPNLCRRCHGAHCMSIPHDQHFDMAVQQRSPIRGHCCRIWPTVPAPVRPSRPGSELLAKICSRDCILLLWSLGHQTLLYAILQATWTKCQKSKDHVVDYFGYCCCDVACLLRHYPVWLPDGLVRAHFKYVSKSSTKLNFLIHVSCLLWT